MLQSGMKRLAPGYCALAAWVTLLAVPGSALAAGWSPPATVPGQSGPAVVFPLAFTASGVGLIATEAGPAARPLTAAVVGDRPRRARIISRSLRIAAYALFGRRQFVGAGSVSRGGRQIVEAGFGTIGGRFGEVQRVATRRLGFAIAADANVSGTVAIAFQKDRGLDLAVRALGERRFGRATRISGGAHALSDPSVKVNSRGDVLVVWTASLPAARNRSPVHEVMARMRFAGGGLSPLRRLGAGSDGFGSDLATAFTTGRRALVAWQALAGPKVAYASRGGHFRHAQTLDHSRPADTDLGAPSQIRVAFSSHGTGVAVWSAGPPNRTVRAARLSGNSFGPPHVLSSPGIDANVDALAAGPRGELITTWTASPTAHPRVFAAALRPTAGGRWDPAELVANASSSQVAIDPRTDVPFATFALPDAGFRLGYSTRPPVA
jgi:hypothetical protein